MPPGWSEYCRKLQLLFSNNAVNRQTFSRVSLKNISWNRYLLYGKKQFLELFNGFKGHCWAFFNVIKNRFFKVKSTTKWGVRCPMVHLGSFWLILAHSWSVWLILAQSGSVRLSLAQSGSVWLSLAQSGLEWFSLEINCIASSYASFFLHLIYRFQNLVINSISKLCRKLLKALSKGLVILDGFVRTDLGFYGMSRKSLCSFCTLTLAFTPREFSKASLAFEGSLKAPQSLAESQKLSKLYFEWWLSTFKLQILWIKPKDISKIVL